MGLGNLPSLTSRQMVLFDMPRRGARVDTRKFAPAFRGSWVVGVLDALDFVTFHLWNLLESSSIVWHYFF